MPNKHARSLDDPFAKSRSARSHRTPHSALVDVSAWRGSGGIAEDGKHALDAILVSEPFPNAALALAERWIFASFSSMPTLAKAAPSHLSSHMT
jgi:hypothetical protein